MTETIKKPEKIQTMDCLRVLGAFMICLGHSWAFVPFTMPDLGGKSVELFFLLSGFLYAYNYYDRQLDATVKSSVRFAYRHIRKYWPLHVITAALMFYWLRMTGTIAPGKPGGVW